MNGERPERTAGPPPVKERREPPEGEIFYLEVPPKHRTGEAIMLLAALALLFVLLAVLVGHPKPAPHPQTKGPAHTSAVR